MLFYYNFDGVTAANQARLVFRPEDLRIPCHPSAQAGPGMHKHSCPVCQMTWKHPDGLQQATKEQFEEGHTCPDCARPGVYDKADWEFA